jgi:DNA-directed RNA polymerase subunit RPC12/RpoP
MEGSAMPSSRTIVDFACPACGAGVKTQRVAATYVQCRECSTRRPFVRTDLINVTGCPGAGKTTAGRVLLRRLGPEFVVVDTDLVCQPTDNVDERTWNSFIECLLRLVVCIAHGGHRPVLVGYSTPWQWDDQPLRPFLGRIRHIALYCSDAELDRRLRQREWLDARERPGLLDLNRRFRTMPDVHRIDTTGASPDDVAAEIAALLGG